MLLHFLSKVGERRSDVRLLVDNLAQTFGNHLSSHTPGFCDAHIHLDDPGRLLGSFASAIVLRTRCDVACIELFQSVDNHQEGCLWSCLLRKNGRCLQIACSLALLTTVVQIPLGNHFGHDLDSFSMSHI